MKMTIRGIAVALASTLTPGALCGCAGGTPSVESSLAEAKVSGSVRVEGKAAKGGEVVFNPANHLRKVGARSAPIDADGRYEITTLLGQNSVSVGLGRRDPGRPPSYVSRTFEVRPGTNQFDIDVALPGPSKGR